MYALTLWQPWASLVIGGWKPYEFRSYALPVSFSGQRIVIHAGKRPIKRAEVAEMINRLRKGEATGGLDPTCVDWLDSVHTSPGRLPLGAGIGTAVLGEPKLSCQVWPQEFAHYATDSDRIRHSNWAWPLTGVERFEPIVPRAGAQGFWRWS